MITISATFTVLQVLLAWCRRAGTVLRVFPTINCDISPNCINLLLFVMDVGRLVSKFELCHRAQPEG
jgi:hypothetical protein